MSYIKLSKPGYVLVYGEDESGEKIFLGSSDLLPAGDSFNVIVKHRSDKRTSSGTTVTAVAVADDGDGVFDLEIDNNQIADESEVDVDADAKDPVVLTIVEIGELIEDAGFDVTAEDALQTETSEEMMKDATTQTVVDDAANEMIDSDT